MSWAAPGTQERGVSGSRAVIVGGTKQLPKAEIGNGLSPGLRNQIGSGFKFQFYHLLTV